MIYAPAAPKTSLIPDDAVGATVVYEDAGCWGYTPASDRVGKIVGVEPSKYHGRYFLVEVDGSNLPRKITEAQILVYMHPSITELVAA